MNWWTRLLGSPAADADHGTLGPFTPLTIGAAGLCCAVGHDLAAATCALRANMDHFQHSDFTTPGGDRLVVARLPEQKVWGSARLTRWVAQAIADCLSRSEGMAEGSPIASRASEQCALLVLGPLTTGDDSSSVHGRIGALARDAAEQLGLQFHPASRVLPIGRAGIASALQQASQWLQNGPPHLAEQRQMPPIRSVLLVAVDSLLDAQCIDELIEVRRVLTPGNSDGFIPGEASAAVLLRAKTGTQFNPSNRRALHIAGVGQGMEPARWNGDVPNRSHGLTQAIRNACSQVPGLTPQQLLVRLSDQNGEGFYTREAATAFTRLRFGAPAQNDLLHLTLADKIGEVGAAMPVAGMAWLWQLWQQGCVLPGAGARGNAAWGPAVVHAANDDGRRAAVILTPES